MKKYNTFFFDIDGTIFRYRKFETYGDTPAILTPGAFNKLNEINDAGHMIVLTTARPEGLRALTQRELGAHRIPYDKLVMGIARGPRHLINDMSPDKPGPRAIAWNIERDSGLVQIEVPTNDKG